MSMNLTLHVGCVEVGLCQTPTTVTWECLGKDIKGETRGVVKGSKQNMIEWDKVACRYLKWVKEVSSPDDDFDPYGSAVFQLAEIRRMIVETGVTSEWSFV